ncbi:MAG: hypothetical protein AAB492_00320 [Patescibacteria group bacterium]
MSFQETPVSIKKRVIFTVLVLIVGAMLSLFLIVNFHTFFRLERIEVVGTGAVFAADTAKLSSNVLFFPTKTLEDELRTNYPLFQTVTVTKKLPRTIVITYTLKDPSYYLESAGHTYGVDDHGIILGEYDKPFIHPIMSFDIGVQSIGVLVVDARVRAAVAFLRALDPSIQVAFVKQYSQTAFMVNVDSLDVLVPVDGDMGEKARALLFLQNGFRIKGVLPSMVDLRFSKPVVTK